MVLNPFGAMAVLEEYTGGGVSTMNLATVEHLAGVWAA